MQFRVGDRVRVLNHDPWEETGDIRPQEVLGTILSIHDEPDSTSKLVLVKHDLHHPWMHDGGDKDPTNHSYWYFTYRDLELIDSLSINPALDLDSIL